MVSFERDGESELDFAQARNYSAVIGRFLQIDPLMASASPADPQTWNRFLYVLNTPLKYIDPTGKDFEDLSDKQKSLVVGYFGQVEKKGETSLGDLYNSLRSDIKDAFESITNALEKTKILDRKGKDTGMTALDLVESLDFDKPSTELNGFAIRGFDGAGGKNESFRLFVTYKQGTVGLLRASGNFTEGDALEHPAMKAGFRESGSPSIQMLYDKTGLRGEIDIDYRHNLSGKVLAGVGLLFGKKVGAMSVDNSNYNAPGNKEKYESKYGQIPRQVKK